MRKKVLNIYPSDQDRKKHNVLLSASCAASFEPRCLPFRSVSKASSDGRWMIDHSFHFQTKEQEEE